MFARKTVFVIGAGCSREYGLPVGDVLRDDIANRLTRLEQLLRDDGVEPDFGILDAIQRKWQGETGPWLAMAGQMARGIRHASSIDRYLDFRQDNERIVWLGKLLIVRTILDAERNSTLPKGMKSLDHNLIEANADDRLHWLGQIFLQMQEGATQRSAITDVFRNVVFICFNYDRCIEHYFFNAVKEMGSLADHEAASALEGLRIFHPYGRIGALPWEATNPGTRKVEFGKETNYGDELGALADEIKTFTEKIEEGDDLFAMRQAIMDAQQIVFMGFSFLDQNIDLITPSSQAQARGIMATVFNESKANQDIASELIKLMLNGRSAGPNYPFDPVMIEAKAGRFLRDWGRSLSR